MSVRLDRNLGILNMCHVSLAVAPDNAKGALSDARKRTHPALYTLPHHRGQSGWLPVSMSWQLAVWARIAAATTQEENLPKFISTEISFPS